MMMADGNTGRRIEQMDKKLEKYAIDRECPLKLQNLSRNEDTRDVCMQMILERENTLKEKIHQAGPFVENVCVSRTLVIEGYLMNLGDNAIMVSKIAKMKRNLAILRVHERQLVLLMEVYEKSHIQFLRKVTKILGIQDIPELIARYKSLSSFAQERKAEEKDVPEELCRLHLEKVTLKQEREKADVIGSTTVSKLELRLEEVKNEVAHLERSMSVDEKHSPTSLTLFQMIWAIRSLYGALCAHRGLPAVATNPGRQLMEMGERLNTLQSAIESLTERPKSEEYLPPRISIAIEDEGNKDRSNSGLIVEELSPGQRTGRWRGVWKQADRMLCSRQSCFDGKGNRNKKLGVSSVEIDLGAKRVQLDRSNSCNVRGGDGICLMSETTDISVGGSGGSRGGDNCGGGGRSSCGGGGLSTDLIVTTDGAYHKCDEGKGVSTGKGRENKRNSTVSLPQIDKKVSLTLPCVNKSRCGLHAVATGRTHASCTQCCGRSSPFHDVLPQFSGSNHGDLNPGSKRTKTQKNGLECLGHARNNNLERFGQREEKGEKECTKLHFLACDKNKFRTRLQSAKREVCPEKQFTLAPFS